jgi:hypothetical protein
MPGPGRPAMPRGMRRGFPHFPQARTFRRTSTPCCGNAPAMPGPGRPAMPRGARRGFPHFPQAQTFQRTSTQCRGSGTAGPGASWLPRPLPTRRCSPRLPQHPTTPGSGSLQAGRRMPDRPPSAVCRAMRRDFPQFPQSHRGHAPPVARPRLGGHENEEQGDVGTRWAERPRAGHAATLSARLAAPLPAAHAGPGRGSRGPRAARRC